jgi:hypothetical protein
LHGVIVGDQDDRDEMGVIPRATDNPNYIGGAKPC